jgi:hypothetical protein
MTTDQLVAKYSEMLDHYIAALESQQTMPGVRWPDAQRFYREMIDWLTQKLTELGTNDDDGFERVSRIIL